MSRSKEPLKSEELERVRSKPLIVSEWFGNVEEIFDDDPDPPPRPPTGTILTVRAFER